jgi:single-strand DNA-binding protein
MQKNEINLMGFLGKDAKTHTGTNNKQFTTLRLGTSKSWKDKETGKYVNAPTQRHDLIVFNKLGEFAATLKKGAHIDIDGELQYSEYKGVQKASILVNSIRKLDRAEKASPEELENEPAAVTDDIPF